MRDSSVCRWRVGPCWRVAWKLGNLTLPRYQRETAPIHTRRKQHKHIKTSQDTPTANKPRARKGPGTRGNKVRFARHQEGQNKRHEDVLGEVPFDGADAQASSLLVLEELVEGDSTKPVYIDLG